jgi:hypothetical protein
VKVRIFLPRNGAKLPEVVYIPRLGRAGNTHYRHDLCLQSLSLIIFFYSPDLSFQSIDINPVVRIYGHIYDVFLSKPEDVSRLFYGIVTPLRNENHKPRVTMMPQCPVDSGLTNTGKNPVGRESFFPGDEKGDEVAQGTVGGNIAEGNTVVLDVFSVEAIASLKDNSMNPGQKLSFHKTGGLCSFDLDLVLV